MKGEVELCWRTVRGRDVETEGGLVEAYRAYLGPAARIFQEEGALR